MAIKKVVALVFHVRMIALFALIDMLKEEEVINVSLARHQIVKSVNIRDLYRQQFANNVMMDII